MEAIHNVYHHHFASSHRHISSGCLHRPPCLPSSSTCTFHLLSMICRSSPTITRTRSNHQRPLLPSVLPLPHVATNPCPGRSSLFGVSCSSFLLCFLFCSSYCFSEISHSCVVPYHSLSCSHLLLLFHLRHPGPCASVQLHLLFTVCTEAPTPTTTSLL